MLTYHNQSDTVVVVLHEIYGINSHIRQVCDTLAQYGMDVIAPDLLGEVFAYEQEDIAYDNFMNNIGFEAAYKKITEVLQMTRTSYKKVYVLGYSIGATLAWNCSATGLCDGAIGFYGSRIRNYLALTPTCPVLLFFPEQEKSFAVDDLIVRVSSCANVRVEKLAGQHGFADAFSPSYNQESAKKAYKEMLAFIGADFA
ncbi:MAG: dienelactone hydrolase [Firmicutes bacterium]|nr:dienelactone hydrolase [Bacillota bacterium]